MGSRAFSSTGLVALIADNPETIDGMQGYLRCSGVVAQSACGKGNDDVFPAATAIVWFADDFAPSAVIAAVGRLQRQRPGLPILLLTNQPERFTQLLSPKGEPVKLVLLPKRATGGTVLDALWPLHSVERANSHDVY